MAIDSARRARPPEPPVRLGEILKARRAITDRDLRTALRRQRRCSARLGEILSANGLARPEAVASALALQRGLDFVDLDATPPMPGLLRDRDLDHCLRRRVLPWRLEQGRMLLASPEPDALAGAEPFLRRALGLAPDQPIAIVGCAPDAFDRLLAARFAQALARRASRRTPTRLSARAVTGLAAQLLIGGVLVGSLAALVLAPVYAISALFALALLFNILNIGLRLATMALPPIRSFLPCARLGTRARKAAKGAAPDPRVKSRAAPLPRISIIVALYREPRMAESLVAALKNLDYPRERLEVLLALEADDEATRIALDAQEPPPWMRIIVTPEGGPRTKPRALNHALDFARGEIIGVYDAEDRPDPDQLLKTAAAFEGATAKLACVQARLAFRNESDGWIARCFAVEYATWFHVMLPGMARLGFPLPLGGTSVFFRRAALERLGAWDAHNVTEDADLGIRLARAGYVTGIIDSETAEEATRTALAWIRQRSRWQKGYLLTWLTHMRAPARLWRDLGMGGFLGFQTLFLGSASAFLAQPLFWAVWIWWPLAGPVYDSALMTGASGLALKAGLLAGQGVVIASSLLALRRAGRRGLTRTALSLPLYWPLGAVSAIKSLIEAAIAPRYWDKTEHGQGRAAAPAPPDPTAP